MELRHFPFQDCVLETSQTPVDIPEPLHYIRNMPTRFNAFLLLNICSQHRLL